MTKIERNSRRWNEEIVNKKKWKYENMKYEEGEVIIGRNSILIPINSKPTKDKIGIYEKSKVIAWDFFYYYYINRKYFCVLLYMYM